MSVDIEPIPESFLARLLDEFGLQWTHLVIISGVVFTSFQLEEYLNAGVWILGTVAAFSVAYVFRHQVGDNFPKIVLWSSLAVVGALAAPVLVLRSLDHDFAVFVKEHSELVSLYLAATTGVPVGVSILSYRKQDPEQFAPLPNELTVALQKAILRAPIVQSSVTYVLSLDLVEDEVGRGVVLDFEVTMHVVNRSRQTVTYADIFDPAGRNRYFRFASLNGAPVNVKSPDRLTERALVLQYSLPPDATHEVNVAGGSTFNPRDSEIVGCYLPTGRMSIVLRKPSNELTFNFQSLLPENVDPVQLDNGDIRFEYNRGILPFQGTRLFWNVRPDPVVDPHGP